jgi:hypothetical protein
MKRPDAPRCPDHVSREMTYIGEAFTKTWAGRKICLGWRFRCLVEGCHRVDLIEPKQPEPPAVKSPPMTAKMKRQMNRFPS